MRKKFLAVLLALCMVIGMAVPAFAAFDDVPDDHWAASSIERWNGYGVLNGDDKGAFTPNKVMTRAEFAQMLVNMLGLTAKGSASFDDAEDHWAADVISIAVKAGIINGKGGNKFAPDDPVSFEEAAVMMCRAFGLAKNEGGANWSKSSIDKLTSLGMIGEGADEHLQVGVDCNRAVVAKLADVVVAKYVTEDTELTGEITGVVIAAKGAKVEIKDATVAAPIVAASGSKVEVKDSAVDAVVVDSAEVALTNTTAKDVTVAGDNASVAADEKSSVENVSVAGETPAVEIKGEVAGTVTVEEGTTGAEIKGDGIKADAVVNNSTEDVTVNGETVEGKPEEPAPEEPDPENPDANTGSSDDEAEGVTIEAPSADDLELDEDSKAADKIAAGDPVVTEDEDSNCETHEWENTEDAPVAATCTTKGSQNQRCKNCEATRIVYTASADHTAGAAEPLEGSEGNCTHQSVMVVKCSVCEGEMSRYAGPADPSNHKTEDTLEAVAATCTATGLTGGKKCHDCGKILEAQTVIPALGHNFSDNAETCKRDDCEVANPNHTASTGPEGPGTDPEEEEEVCSQAASCTNGAHDESCPLYEG